MDNNLAELFDKQSKLQARINGGLDNLSIEDKERWTKETVLAMHSELTEVLDWISWKHWKKTKVEYTQERIKEIHFELIDLLHFWINLCLIWGLDSGKVMDIYGEKNSINHKRQDNGY